MRPSKYAILINSDNIDLITFLNGGVKPWESAHGDYFVCELPVGSNTAKDKIVDAAEMWDHHRADRHVIIK